MSMRNQIHNAYNKVHAPEEAVEYLKQELYRRDTSGDTEYEIHCTARNSRPQIGGYMMYIAAVAVICVGAGMAWNSIQQYKNPIRPGMAVYTEAPTGEPASYDPLAESIVPDVTNYHFEYAKKILADYGYECSIQYEASDEIDPAHVIRTVPEASAFAEQGSVICIYVSKG